MAISLNTPARVSLQIPQGARYIKAFSWSQDSAQVELDDYEIRAEIRSIPRGKLIADLTPFFTIDPVLDEILLDIPASASWLIDRDGEWDLFLVHATIPDNTVKLLGGLVKIIRAVTRVR